MSWLKIKAEHTHTHVYNNNNNNNDNNNDKKIYLDIHLNSGQPTLADGFYTSIIGG
jgi:hypothetical protein